jgi:hypothetical protein
VTIKKRPSVISIKKYDHDQQVLQERIGQQQKNYLRALRKIEELEKIIESSKNIKELGSLPEIAIKALEYYGSKDNYRLIKSFTHYYRIIREGGKLAREALDAISNK